MGKDPVSYAREGEAGKAGGLKGEGKALPPASLQSAPPPARPPFCLSLARSYLLEALSKSFAPLSTESRRIEGSGKWTLVQKWFAGALQSQIRCLGCGQARGDGVERWEACGALARAHRARRRRREDWGQVLVDRREGSKTGAGAFQTRASALQHASGVCVAAFSVYLLPSSLPP
eukprot:6172236-Pleurochrysis_carterae.AAC.1